jgi:amidase
LSALDLMTKPVADLAALVRGGELSARETVGAALERIDALDGQINAFVDVEADRALAEASLIEPGDERPFAGVPIAIKANTPVAGMCMNYGSRFVAGHRPGHSAYLVRRLREAGFVIVGITNMPEFGIITTTEPRHTGPTHNPWDLSRTPGGSSGGSAAAVAAGMLPVAHGNDGGGSIRVPAACCGLVGLKASRGRVSSGPDLGESWLSCQGVLTHSVADTAHLLDVLAGYEVGDANWAPRPAEAYGLAARRDPGRLRVAMTSANALGVEPDAADERAMRAVGELLDALGHDVVEASPHLPGEDVLPLFIRAFAPHVTLQISLGELLAGRPPEADEIEPLSRAVAELARELDSVSYLAAVAQLQALARSIVAFFAEYDLLLTPVLAERPLPIGECNGLGEHPLDDLARSGRFTPYTALFNVTGQPAISVPVGFADDGLPLGVQLVGKPLGEDTLLQVASQFAAARPLERVIPEISAGPAR